MSTTDQIAHLQKAVEDFAAQTNEQYGATKKLIEEAREKSESDIGEIKERMSQASAELATKDEVKETVLALQDELSALKAADRPTQEFDTQVLKSADEFTPAQCRTAVDQFMLSETKDSDITELQDIHDKLMMVKALREPKGSSWSSETMHEQGGFGAYHWAKDRDPVVRGMYNRYRGLWSKFAADDFRQKAFDTTDDSEWIPDILSSQLMKYLEIRGAVVPLFRSVPMPGPVWRVPITTSVDQAVLEPEGTGTGTTTVTHPTQLYSTSPISRANFDVQKLRAGKEVFTDYIQDSVVPMIPFMMEDMGDAIRRAIEDAIINGDHDSSGTDADNITATHARRAWEGLRAIAEENSKTLLIGSTFATADLYTAARNMGRYGIVPSDRTWICGMRSFFDLMALSDLTTYSTFRDRATLITGELMSVMGSRVVVSEYVREDLAATGLNATTTDTDTIIILVHTPSWWLGNWRGITLERERVAAVDSEFVYARWRGDFQKMRASTETTEVVIAGLDA